jgi:hypothetical protein
LAGFAARAMAHQSVLGVRRAESDAAAAPLSVVPSRAAYRAERSEAAPFSDEPRWESHVQVQTEG